MKLNAVSTAPVILSASSWLCAFAFKADPQFKELNVSGKRKAAETAKTTNLRLFTLNSSKAPLNIR
jgi:hypothetical protein